MKRSHIEPIGYTMEEAAQRLRIGRRNLQELVKDHPYYYSNGARKLFTEDDIAALIKAMRSPKEPDRMRLGAGAARGRKTIRSSADIEVAARRLLAKPSRQKS